MIRSLSVSLLVVACLFLVIFFGSGCNRAKIVYESGSIKEIFDRAELKNKKIFILVTDKGCKACLKFEDFLNGQSEAVQELTKNYICVKADVHDSENGLAQLLKTPSYPFPYFFDHTGKLLAFGFPNSEKFDVRDLNNITVSDKFFSEQFRLKISTANYKTLISETLKTIRLSPQTDSSAWVSALESSLQIAPYPFNIRLANQHLKNSVSDTNYLKTLLRRYTPIPSDVKLYGSLSSYMMVPDIFFEKYKHRSGQLKYEFQTSLLDLGTIDLGKARKFIIKIANISMEPLKVVDVRHSCDCIKLKWPPNLISPGSSAVIQGEFVPYQTGKFNKDIYVYTKPGDSETGVFKINGIVQ